MMNYRDTPAARFYVCPGCSAPEQGPAQGGAVACSRCRTPFDLPDRSAMLANPGMIAPPDNNPQRLQQLRMQDGRPRLTPPTLQAVLGGDNVMPGREQEAIMVWQSLRARASQGDVAASEDMSMLSLLLAQTPAMQQQLQMKAAIAESSYDAGVLPRHKQEQLGRVVRMAVAAGDRARALRYLSWMMPNAPELDADSEFRVSSAAVATLDRNPQRVLELLGPQKDAIPIVDSMDAMASVFRANAYEMMGNVGAATQILNELPQARMLGMIRGAYPSLQLCAQAAGVYESATTQQAAQRAASGAGFIGVLVGGMLALSGVIAILAGGIPLAIAAAGGGIALGAEIAGSAVPMVIGIVLLVVGIVVFSRGRAKGKRAAWLRTNGLSLQARIVDAQRTGTMINEVPVYRFILQVAGPHGPYQASFNKLAPEHQVAMIMGRDVRVRADPNKLDDVILEE